MASTTSEQYWRGKAKRLANQVNCGWFIQRWVTIAVPSFTLGAAGILLARYQGWEPSHTVLLSAGGGALLATLLGAWWWARKHFLQAADAMVRLEAKLGLNSTLSAAAEGICGWPDPDPAPSPELADYQWRWARVLLPGALAAACLAAALLVPIGSSNALATTTQEPAAWGQMEDWLETLEEEEIVEPDSAEEIREQIDSLRDRPEGEWFSHHSLEAGDSLQEALQNSIQQLAQGLSMAEQALGQLPSPGAAASEGMREKLAEQYAEAMEQLASNPLALNSKLMEQLSQLDPSQLKPLSKEQMDELRERLRKSAGT